MSDTCDYRECLRLANDPSLTDEARREYRARLEAYTHQRMREAFRCAVKTTAPSSRNE